MKNNPIIKNSLKAAIILAISAPVAQAADFYFGENEDIQLSINSQISIGSSWRMKDNDPNLRMAANAFDGVYGTQPFGTSDDDNLNFGKHDAFSTIIKGFNDFKLEQGDFGAFVRVKYWYDIELKDGNRPHGNSVNGYTAGIPLSDDGFSDTAKFAGIQLLDAYVYGGFEIAEVPIDVRLGRQVVSWGESTFIQGGINTINPLDVSALRRPGATLKEGLLPVGMLFANAGLTENLSVEAFYQYEWQKTEIDGCGTYFSTHDYVADGCDYITVMGGDKAMYDAGMYAYRRADIEPDDGGQYGIAVRYYSEALNDTEFGFYYTNLHSRLPSVNAIRSTHAYNYMNGLDTDPNPIRPVAGQGVSGDHTADMLNGGYQIQYHEDFKTYGLSFATNVGGIALSGEIAYKPDQLMHVNGNHAVGAALFDYGIAAQQTPGLADDYDYIFPFSADRIYPMNDGTGLEGNEAISIGYEHDVTQLQVTAIQFFDQVLGAQRITFIGEVGLTLVDGVEAVGPYYQYGRDTLYGFPEFTDADKGQGFYTDSSWGYRTRVEFDYPDLFAGIALKPVLSWYHDVDGYGDQFNEGSTVAAIAIEAIYQQQYSLTVSYTNFGGGDWNTNTDKDFLSVSFALSY